MRKNLLAAAAVGLTALTVSSALAAEPIMTEPQGRSVYYNADAVIYDVYGTVFDDFLVSILTRAEDYAASMTEGENGTAYINNPIVAFNYLTWIEAKREGDKLTVDLTQPFTYLTPRDGEPRLFYLAVFDNEADPGSKNYVKTDETQVVYNIQGDKIILDLTGEGFPEGEPAVPSRILGLCDEDGNYMHAGVSYACYTPTGYTPVEVPDDLKTSDYVVAGDNMGRQIAIGFDGDDVYFQGLAQYYPLAWVKGAMEDGAISIPSWQVIGITSDVWTYFVGGEFIADANSLVIGDGIRFEYDSESGELTTDPANAYFINGSLSEVKWASFVRNPIMKPYVADFDISLMDPVYVEYRNIYGMNMITFEVPNITADNNLLDVDKLFYRFYLNNELEELDPDYYGIDGTDIPWTYVTPTGFINVRNASHDFVYLYEGIETIGCQAVYKDGDREYVSGITTYNVIDNTTTSSVKEVTPSLGEGKVEFFDLAGRAVQHPRSGIFIRRVTSADGSVSTSKVAVK